MRLVTICHHDVKGNGMAGTVALAQGRLWGLHTLDSLIFSDRLPSCRLLDSFQGEGGGYMIMPWSPIHHGRFNCPEDISRNNNDYYFYRSYHLKHLLYARRLLTWFHFLSPTILKRVLLSPLINENTEVQRLRLHNWEGADSSLQNLDPSNPKACNFIIINTGEKVVSKCCIQLLNI